ncbi:uncharacterized protein LOC105833797 [Monomorium pharaonis]|uniref:uncharacterized protein LOC105833797 n=1 Tax=Monomorium pharaonis TaxID=307658 RepID=UPI00063F660F|nr:uncharacterized protein LOC105833797 [Monomorium pharaonis]XP_012531248.1 uncharacterized protein LOC105833797 [Monomorium pharaonis]XP_036149713.1 uncharacterized protein LOC105833797 [Monomorium pharaonis]
MDKNACDGQINKKLFTTQPPSNNHLNYKIPQSVATKLKDNEKNNDSNIFDYKNILLKMTGEISSGFIHRNNLTQKQPNINSIEDTEDDDEKFILDMKIIIDKNCNMQNKENFGIRDLQSKSYLLRKKKCAFSNEDQNLIKRFKKSLDENKASCGAPKKLQQSEQQIDTVDDNNCSTTLQITPTTIKYNGTDTNFRCNTNELLFRIAAKDQRNNQWITPDKEKTITEIEIEQLTYHEMQYFTPPQKDDL